MQREWLPKILSAFVIIVCSACNEDLPAKLGTSLTEMEFGPDDANMSFAIINEGSEELSWSITPSASWLSCSSTSGSLAGESSFTIQVTIDRAELNDKGTDLGSSIEHKGIIFISSNAGSIGINVALHELKNRFFFLRSYSEPTVIYTATFGGNNEKVISHKNYIRLRLSSNGQKIVATSSNEEEGKTSIVTMNVDGTSHKTLYSEGSYNDYPSWSHDGTEIAFVSYVENSYEIFIMNNDGTNVRQITDGVGLRKYSSPVLTPDRQKIVFTYSDEIAIMNSDGSNLRVLTNNEANDYDPDISADGSIILFTSNRSGRIGSYTMSLDGSNVQQLAEGSYGARFGESDEVLFGSFDSDDDSNIFSMNKYGENIEKSGYLSNIYGGGMIDW